MNWFGPPCRDYRHFNLHMGRSPGFASSAYSYSPYSDSLSLRLRSLRSYTCYIRLTRRLIMQKARRHPVGLRPLVSVWFQVLFTPLLGVLFTFPSQYWFTIGLSGVFSLGRWCCHIQTGFHRPRPTRLIHIKHSYTGLSPSLVSFSKTVLLILYAL